MTRSPSAPGGNCAGQLVDEPVSGPEQPPNRYLLLETARLAQEPDVRIGVGPEREVGGRELRNVIDDDIRQAGGEQAALLQREEEVDVLAGDLHAGVPGVRSEPLDRGDEELVDDVEDGEAVDRATRRAEAVHQRSSLDVQRALVARNPRGIDRQGSWSSHMHETTSKRVETSVHSIFSRSVRRSKTMSSSQKTTYSVSTCRKPKLRPAETPSELKGSCQ